MEFVRYLAGSQNRLDRQVQVDQYRSKRKKTGNNVRKPKNSDTNFPAISQSWTMA